MTQDRRWQTTPSARMAAATRRTQDASDASTRLSNAARVSHLSPEYLSSQTQTPLTHLPRPVQGGSLYLSPRAQSLPTMSHGVAGVLSARTPNGHR